jgi:hypothetical protein
MAFSNKRRIIAAVGISSVLALALIIAAVTYLPTQQETSTATSPAVGLSPVYLWDIGHSTTLQEAADSVNYSLITPSYLPSGSSLTQVRYAEDANFVLLAYTITGVSPIGGNSNPGGWGLLIVEQSSSSNPLPAHTTVERAVVATTAYPNGTTVTSTIAQASTITSGWQNATIAGQSVLIESYSAQVESEIQWWSHNVWYQAFGGIPMSQLESMASSMITPPASQTS